MTASFIGAISANVAPSVERAALNKKGWKWIAREIERLDPNKDYDRIWELSTCYYLNDIIINIIYTTGIQCFTQPPEGSILLTLNHKGKSVERKQDRAIDTLQHFWKWFEFGPRHPDVADSIEYVNRTHAAMSAKLPGAFPSRDFIYTSCWTGCNYHRLRQEIGLKGYTENQKIAVHRYWTEMMKNFRGQEGYITDYPKSFDEMLKFMADYEAHPWPKVETGKELANALTEQFCERWFPWGFRWIGRQTILALQNKKIRDLMQMGDPNPIMMLLVRKGMATYVYFRENIWRDPKFSTPERARMKKIRPAFHGEPPKAKRTPDSTSACPFHSVLRS